MHLRVQGSLVLLLLGCLLLQAWAVQAPTGAVADPSGDVIGMEETLQSEEFDGFEVAVLHKKARKQGKCVHKKQVVECNTPGSYDPSKSNRHSHSSTSNGVDPVHHKRQSTKYEGQYTSDSTYASPSDEDAGSPAPGAYQSGKKHSYKNKQGQQASLQMMPRAAQEDPTQAEVSYGGQSHMSYAPTKKKQHKHKNTRSHSGTDQQAPPSEQYGSHGYGDSAPPSNTHQYDDSSYTHDDVPAPGPKPKKHYEEESEESEDHHQSPTPTPSRKHKSYKTPSPPPSPPPSSPEYEEYDVYKAYKHHRRSSRRSSQHKSYNQHPSPPPSKHNDDDDSYNQPPPSPPPSKYSDDDSKDEEDSKTDKEPASPTPSTQKHHSGHNSHKHSSPSPPPPSPPYSYDDESADDESESEGGDDDKETDTDYKAPSPPPNKHTSYMRPPPPASYKYEDYEDTKSHSHKAHKATPAPKYPVDDDDDGNDDDDDVGKSYKGRDSHSHKKSTLQKNVIKVEAEEEDLEGSYGVDAANMETLSQPATEVKTDPAKPAVPAPVAPATPAQQAAPAPDMQQARNTTQAETISAEPYGLQDARYWQTLNSNGENSGKSEQEVAA